MYSIFSRVFSLRKNSARKVESFVGAGGQNPDPIQKRGSFLTFLKSTSKFNLSGDKSDTVGMYSDIMLPCKICNRHKMTILNIPGEFCQHSNGEIIYFLFSL